MSLSLLLTTQRRADGKWSAATRRDFVGILLADILARRVPVSAFCRYHVSLQRKKRCQQVISLDDESFFRCGVHRRNKEIRVC